MKTRNGFVSNSSSSSFVIAGVYRDWPNSKIQDDVKKFLTSIGFSEEESKQYMGLTSIDKDGLKAHLRGTGLSFSKVEELMEMDGQTLVATLEEIGFNEIFVNKAFEYFKNANKFEFDIWEFTESEPKGLSFILDGESSGIYIGKDLESMDAVLAFDKTSLQKLAETLKVKINEINIICETVYA